MGIGNTYHVALTVFECLEFGLRGKLHSGELHQQLNTILVLISWDSHVSGIGLNLRYIMFFYYIQCLAQ